MRTYISRISTYFVCFIMLAGMFLMSHKVCVAEQIEINFPTDRGIYQRNYDNTADVSVTAVYDGEGHVKARIVNGDSVINDWTELGKSETSKYSGVIPDVPAGGWYQLEVAVYDDSGSEIASAAVEHIGVGEVFITGGQSNSCNFGGAKTAAAYDTVSAYDAAKGTWQHCEDSQPNSSGFATGNGGGSPWPTLGDELTERLGIPVGFCSTGFGGTTIEGLCTEHYETIRQAITGLSRYGYRAFLIHQGEADTDATPMDEYSESFKKLIAMTREDAGYDLVWVIAQVSYAWSNYNNTAKMEAITGTQRSLCNNYDIFIGPTTDDLLGDYRHTDNLHLSEKGLIEHGKRWADVLMTSLFTRYQINADSSVTHGKITQCSNSYYAGESIKLTAQADDGYYLVPGSFKVTGSEGEIELSDDTFKMRAENLTVTAEFAQLPKNLLDSGDKIKEAENKDTDSVPGVAAGDIYTAGNLKYKVTKAGNEKKVSVIGLVNKNKPSVTIPKTVTINGDKYKVVSIAKKAFAKAKKLKKIVIKSVYIKSIGKNAFTGTNAKLRIKVPVKKLAAYRKLIRKSGFKKVSGIVK